jgi:hypothetical protein
LLTGIRNDSRESRYVENPGMKAGA